jgi:hypothetical protein
VVFSKADDMGCSPGMVILSISDIRSQQPGHMQAGIVTVRSSMSMNLGGSWTVQALSELVLQYFALSFCSSDREQKEKTNKQKHPAAAYCSTRAAMCFKMLIEKSVILNIMCPL